MFSPCPFGAPVAKVSSSVAGFMGKPAGGGVPSAVSGFDVTMVPVVVFKAPPPLMPSNPFDEGQPRFPFAGCVAAGKPVSFALPPADVPVTKGNGASVALQKDLGVSEDVSSVQPVDTVVETLPWCQVAKFFSSVEEICCLRAVNGFLNNPSFYGEYAPLLFFHMKCEVEKRQSAVPPFTLGAPVAKVSSSVAGFVGKPAGGGASSAVSGVDVTTVPVVVFKTPPPMMPSNPFDEGQPRFPFAGCVAAGKPVSFAPPPAGAPVMGNGEKKVSFNKIGAGASVSTSSGADGVDAGGASSNSPFTLGAAVASVPVVKSCPYSDVRLREFRSPWTSSYTVTTQTRDSAGGGVTLDLNSLVLPAATAPGPGDSGEASRPSPWARWTPGCAQMPPRVIPPRVQEEEWEWVKIDTEDEVSEEGKKEPDEKKGEMLGEGDQKVVDKVGMKEPDELKGKDEKEGLMEEINENKVRNTLPEVTERMESVKEQRFFHFLEKMRDIKEKDTKAQEEAKKNAKAKMVKVGNKLVLEKDWVKVINLTRMVKARLFSNKRKRWEFENSVPKPRHRTLLRGEETVKNHIFVFGRDEDSEGSEMYFGARPVLQVGEGKTPPPPPRACKN